MSSLIVVFIATPSTRPYSSLQGSLLRLGRLHNYRRVGSSARTNLRKMRILASTVVASRVARPSSRKRSLQLGKPRSYPRTGTFVGMSSSLAVSIAAPSMVMHSSSQRGWLRLGRPHGCLQDGCSTRMTHRRIPWKVASIVGVSTTVCQNLRRRLLPRWRPHAFPRDG